MSRNALVENFWELYEGTEPVRATGNRALRFPQERNLLGYGP
jgi:hypothetical protein